MKKQIQTVKGLAIAGLLTGALLMIPAFVGAAPPGDPPSATVDANFNSVTVGPGSLDYVVSDGGSGDTLIESGGDVFLDMSSGTGSLFFKNNLGATGLSMNSSTIWMPFANPVQIADDLDVTGSISNSTGAVLIDDNVNVTGSKVGIGTVLPQEQLHVNDGNIMLTAEGFDPYLQLVSDGASDATTMRLKSLNNVGFTVTDESDNSRLTVTKDGNVGIGTTSPSQKLDVVGNAEVSGTLNVNGSLYDSTGYLTVDDTLDVNGLFIADSIDATAGTSYGIYAAGNTAGGRFYDPNSSGIASVGYGDYGVYAGGNSSGGYFYTNDTDVNVHLAQGGFSMNAQGPINVDEYSGILYAAGYEALWFDGSTFSWGYGGAHNVFWDRVSIGTNGSSIYKLTVSGAAAKTGGGSWSNWSDERLKDVKGAYEKGLDEIMKLNPIKFNYKSDNPKDLPSDEEFVGFIAQEAQKVFPETVSEDKDGYLDFNMHAVNVAVVNAIQELKSEKDNEIAGLKEDVAALREVVCDINPKADVCNK